MYQWYRCGYLGRMTGHAGCTNPATGRLIGSGGEVGPLACAPCAAVALENEDYTRGYLPLALLRVRFTSYAPGVAADDKIA